MRRRLINPSNPSKEITTLQHRNMLQRKKVPYNTDLPTKGLRLCLLQK